MTSKRRRHLCTCQCLWTRPHWGSMCRKTQSPLCKLQLPQKPKLCRSSPDTQLWRNQSRQRPHLFLHRSLPERRQHIPHLMRLELRPSHQTTRCHWIIQCALKLAQSENRWRQLKWNIKVEKGQKLMREFGARTTEIANALKMVSKKVP